LYRRLPVLSAPHIIYPTTTITRYPRVYWWRICIEITKHFLFLLKLGTHTAVDVQFRIVKTSPPFIGSIPIRVRAKRDDPVFFFFDRTRGDSYNNTAVWFLYTYIYILYILRDSHTELGKLVRANYFIIYCYPRALRVKIRCGARGSRLETVSNVLIHI